MPEVDEGPHDSDTHELWQNKCEDKWTRAESVQGIVQATNAICHHQGLMS